MSNDNLHRAKRAKNDEYYTRIEDVHNELKHYPDAFVGKVVYLNCDSRKSAFWEYFTTNFTTLGLKHLIATHYDQSSDNYRLDYDGEVITTSAMIGDGDFRSDECREIMDGCDVIVSNPPFTLMREYIPVVANSGKQFLIIGPINAITYKTVFPFIQRNELWLGVNANKPMPFIVSDDSDYWDFVDDTGRKIKKVNAITWYTNIQPSTPKPIITLTKQYDPELYPVYDNYNAINVNKVSDIPCDYYGPIGVPITFLTKYNPKQFEVVDIAKRGPGMDTLKTKTYTKDEHDNASDLNAGPVLSGDDGLFNTYPRILIQRKQ